MDVFDGQGRAVGLGNVIGQGGEAAVYRIKKQPERVAKLYLRGPRPHYGDKLRWMIANPPERKNAGSHEALAWPAELLYDRSRQLVGFTMPRIGGAVPLIEVMNPRLRARTLPQFDLRYLHRVARNLAACLRVLHQAGYVAGDLNESNVLVTPSALVSLIDTDSFQVRELRGDQEVVHACPVGKLEYTPPELQGRALSATVRLPEQDAFGLAVLVFQLLMQGNHPFRAQWTGSGEPPPLEDRIAAGAFPFMANPPRLVRPPKHGPVFTYLHPWVAELMFRCFVDGHQDPARRPDPAQWERALVHAEENLAACPRGHYYSNHLPACPFCPPASRRTASAPRPTRRETAGQAPRPAWGAEARSAARQPRPPQPTPRPVPPASPPPRQPASPPPSRPAPRPYWTPATIRNWVRAFQAVRSGGAQPISPTGSAVQPVTNPLATRAFWANSGRKVLKSLGAGGGYGALAGMGSGALLSMAGGAAGVDLAWIAVVAASGAFGAVVPGRKPGARIGEWVGQTVGWRRFWQFVGAITGLAIGAMLALPFVFAIFPVIIGIVTGARFGYALGEKIWEAGDRYGWQRVWVGLNLAGSAAFGGLFSMWVGSGALGQWALGLNQTFLGWVGLQTASQPLLWLAAGAVAGAFGGFTTGFSIDISARLLGLVD
ncbi:MAG TPA: hypothetical protein VFF68_07465 [Anaerolineaceae bacterium]|nr:hypothetical protein [Anaerolineaceae bacterium]